MSLKQAIAELEEALNYHANANNDLQSAHGDLMIRLKAQALLDQLKSAEIGKFHVHSCEFTDKHNMHLTVTSDRCLVDDSGTLYFSPKSPTEPKDNPPWPKGVMR